MSPARLAALHILLDWHRSGSFADRLFRDYWEKNPALEARDRNLAYQLVYGVLRWREKLDWILRQFSSRPLEKISRRTLMILRLGVFQLLFLSRIPARAAVDESVRLAKAGSEPQSGNFVNALLRAIDQGRALITYPDPEDAVAHLSVCHSHPAWLVKTWIDHFGVEKTLDLCRFNNQIPPYTLRVNTLKTDRSRLLEKLRPSAMTVAETPFSPLGIQVIEHHGPLTDNELFSQGLFHIQDEASQLIPFLLDPHHGLGPLRRLRGQNRSVSRADA